MPTPENIYLDDHGSSIPECIVSWSREGYKPTSFAFGDVVRIETTILKDIGDFADSTVLEEQWVGGATSIEKDTDMSKTDVYSRFSTNSRDPVYDVIDTAYEEGTERIGKAPRSYRNIEISTFNYDTNGEAISAGAMVLDTTWKFSGKVGLAVRTSKGAIPYIKFQGGDRTKELTFEGNNKAATCIISGVSRIEGSFSAVGANNDQNEFGPFTVTTSDRFKRYKVYKSYRDNPTGEAVTDIDFRNDIDAANEFAKNTVQGDTLPTITAEITRNGSSTLTVGTVIGSVVTRLGSVNLGLAIVTVTRSFAPPAEAGQGGSDSTTYSIGRK